MRYYIITGTSRGIGEAIAASVLGEGRTVIEVARHANPELEAMAKKKGGKVFFFHFDLSETEKIDGLLDEIFELINLADSEALYLVNNAGVLGPVGRTETASTDEVDYHLKVNLLAPMRLSSGFIARTTDFAGRKVVLNVSSGAAQQPYFGWSSYCAGKAGLEMFTRVVGTEQEEQDNPVVIYAMAPGIVDTAMQAEVRGATEEQFRDLAKFIRFQEKGYLSSPGETGRKLAESLDDPAVKTGDVLDIRSL